MDGIDEAKRLLLSENVRQGMLLRRLDDVNPLPLLLQHMLVEELQPVAIQFDRAPRVGLQQRREIGLQLRGVERVGTAFEESRNAAYRPRIRLDRLGSLALKPQGLLHLLVQGIEAGLLDGSHRRTLQLGSRKKHSHRKTMAWRVWERMARRMVPDRIRLVAGNCRRRGCRR